MTYNGIFSMKPPCSGVILAGGLNLRFSGKNKAFFSVGGELLIDRIYGVFSDLFEEIILVTNDPLPYLAWDLNVITDLFPVRSPLTGIHAGLFFMSTPYAFFAACDTPFLKKTLVKTIVGEIESGIDVIIPETAKGPQPLCAVYSKKCLLPIEKHLALQTPNSDNQRAPQRGLKVQHFFKKVRVKKIPESVFREQDADLISFFNINTPEDLAKAEKLAENL